MPSKNPKSLKQWCTEHGIDMRVYRAWINMRSRSRNPNMPQWKDYGGRGIRVCKRWDSFDAFAADMGPHPGPGWTLDRRRNNRGYFKSNCRWALRKTQTRNRRFCATLRLTEPQVKDIRRRLVVGTRHAPGNTATLAAEFGVSRTTLYDINSNIRWAA